jgi:hypothetical protein
MSDLHEHKHDDFEVVRTDNRFGGYEELRHKDQNARVGSLSFYLLLFRWNSIQDTRFIRKSLTPDNPAELDDLCVVLLLCSLTLPFSFELYRIELQELVMKEGCSGTVHPMYTHNDRKWVLMSVPDEHYGATGLAV